MKKAIPLMLIILLMQNRLCPGQMQEYPPDAKSGEGFVLDACVTSDPDGDNLSYLWFQYTEVGSYKKPIRFDQAEDLYRIPYIKAPEVVRTETAHFILKVTDKGNPSLTRYKRVIVNILPK